MISDKPQVLVACAWYNRPEFIRDTVDSLLEQDFKSYEIVIVNDGSSNEEVSSILNIYRDHRLRIIHQENIGFVGAITRAINESNAPYIAIMGAGDVSLPLRLKRQWEFLESHPEYVGVTCGIKQVVVEGPNHSKIESRSNLEGPITYDMLTKGNPISHGEIMYRRSAFEKVGGYRSIFQYGQDYDLWLRMSLLGNFYSMSEVLYERRRFMKDGVSTDDVKQIIRIRLGDLAVQCARQRREFGYDMLDKYGQHALLFVSPRGDTYFRLFKKIIKEKLSKKASVSILTLDLFKMFKLTAAIEVMVYKLIIRIVK